MRIPLASFALVLALDASAYELNDKDTVWHLDQNAAFTQEGLTVGTWYVRGPNMFAVSAVRGCERGHGSMVLGMNGKNRSFLWNSKDQDATTRIGFLTCVAAFTKENK